MFWMCILLVVAFSAQVDADNSTCKIRSYQDNNGNCLSCPDHCKLCVSNTNCTVCEKNYWGLTCHSECREHCPDQCHKKYGHCRHGCRDGTFGHPSFGSCTNCKPNCEICSSSSDCFRCRTGFYGEYCQKCTDGCASCTDAENCTTCDKSFYGPYNGKCFRECQSTDTTGQSLTSLEDRCRIPNGLMSNNTQLCENVSGDQSYTCSSNRYCLTNTTCSSDDSCSLNQDEDNIADVCLKVRSEECLAKCIPPTTAHQEDVKYLCSQSCTVNNVGDYSYGPVCFHDSTQDSSNVIPVGYPLITIEVLCFPDVDERSLSQEWRIVAIIFIIVSGLLLLLLTKSMYTYCITSRMPIATPKLESHALACSARDSSSNDVVNGTASRLHQPLEESRNMYQHAFPHLVIRRDSMYDHAAPVHDVSQLEVRVDAAEGTVDPFYDHVALADNARQWMVGVDSIEGTAESMHELSQSTPSEDREFPENDLFMADGGEKFGSQAIYTECE